MLLSYNFIIFAKNIYTMKEIKYIPTDYSSNQSVIETPRSIDQGVRYIPTNYSSDKGVIETSWSIDPGVIGISGYQPRLRKRTEEKPVQETVQAETVYSPLVVSTDTSQKSTQVKGNPVKSEGKIYTSKQEFVKDMTAAYTKALAARGISTDYAKMLVAQDAIESNWGKSSLSKAFNFGGVKAVKGAPFVEKETKEYSSKGGIHKTKSKFRRFNSLDDYVNYKINLLSGKRYQAFTGDPSQFYSRVKEGGYATDPNYAAKLTNIYNSSILSAKQGGNIPSRIDLLVKKFNNQFNK